MHVWQPLKSRHHVVLLRIARPGDVEVLLHAVYYTILHLPCLCPPQPFACPGNAEGNWRGDFGQEPTFLRVGKSKVPCRTSVCLV